MSLRSIATMSWSGILLALPPGSEGLRRHCGAGLRRDTTPFTDLVLGPSGPPDDSLVLAHEQLAGDRNDWQPVGKRSARGCVFGRSIEDFGESRLGVGPDFAHRRT